MQIDNQLNVWVVIKIKCTRQCLFLTLLCQIYAFFVANSTNKGSGNFHVCCCLSKQQHKHSFQWACKNVWLMSKLSYPNDNSTKHANQGGFYDDSEMWLYFKKIHVYKQNLIMFRFLREIRLCLVWSIKPCCFQLFAINVDSASLTQSCRYLPLLTQITCKL